MAKQNYTLDTTKKIITATISELDEVEKEIVQMYINAGYVLHKGKKNPWNKKSIMKWLKDNVSEDSAKKFEEDCKKQDEIEFREFAKTHNNLSASEFVLQYYNTTKKTLTDERLYWYLQVYGTNTYGASVAKFVLDNIGLHDNAVVTVENKPKECLKEFKDPVVPPCTITCTCEQPSITIQENVCWDLFSERIEESKTFQKFSQKTVDYNEEIYQMSKAIYQACKMQEDKSITIIDLFNMLYQNDGSKKLEDNDNYKFLAELIKVMSSYGIIKPKALTLKIV